MALAMRGDHGGGVPVSSEISDLLLFISYFASQNKELSLAITFLMCVVQIKTFWLDVRHLQQA